MSRRFAAAVCSGPDRTPFIGPTMQGVLTAGLFISCTRVSTDEQDLTARRDALAGVGVTPERNYIDHGLTGTERERPGLRRALAACREGDTLVVTKLDRLARLTARRSRDPRRPDPPAGQGQPRPVPDPTDPVGRLLFNVPAMVAEFEADLIRLRTREGMQVAKAKGRLRRQAAQAQPRQEAHRVALHRAGQHITAKLGGLFEGDTLDRLPRSNAAAT